MKILMVCHGNICRSPIAHGLLKHKAAELGLSWEIDSAGTSNEHEGELPQARGIACMKRHHVDITYQRSRQITRADLEHFDIIYVMDQYNYRNVINMANSEAEVKKVKMIMNEVDSGSNEIVPDPYYGTEKDYEHVYQMLDKATDAIIEKYSDKTVK